MSLKMKLAKRELSKILARGTVVVTECDVDNRYEGMYEICGCKKIGITIFHAPNEHIKSTKHNYQALRAINKVLDDPEASDFTYLLNVTKKFFKTIC